MFKARFPNPTASGVLAVPSSTHDSRTLLLVECRVQHTVPESHCQCGFGIPVFKARFPSPTVSIVLALPFSRNGSRTPLFLEFWHSRVQQTVPAPHCFWGSGIPVFKAGFPHINVSGVLALPCSKHGYSTPLLVGFGHLRVQGPVPAPHCYWGSGIAVFKARFPHTSVSGFCHCFLVSFTKPRCVKLN